MCVFVCQEGTQTRLASRFGLRFPGCQTKNFHLAHGLFGGCQRRPMTIDAAIHDAWLSLASNYEIGPDAQALPPGASSEQTSEVGQITPARSTLATACSVSMASPKLHPAD